LIHTPSWSLQYIEVESLLEEEEEDEEEVPICPNVLILEPLPIFSKSL